MYAKNEEDIQRYSRSGEFIENMVTDNEIEFCKRWFHLAGFNELLEDANEYFENKMFGQKSYIQAMNRFGDIIETPVIPTSVNGVSEPIIFGFNYKTRPVVFSIPESMKSLLERMD